ncbi:MAG TPA: carboxypeptidase regulatory-like domain-containing protein, partial [Terriglobia bacterium]|nr:carboxypeptidase regulatory-like domain-containing protein [Terriglobia bacterium]
MAGFSAAAEAASVRGFVRDATGLSVLGASVRLADADGRALAESRTGAGGGFAFDAVAPGRYQLLVEAAGFERKKIAVEATEGGAIPLHVQLELAAIASSITVTATRGSVEDVETSSHVVSVADSSKFATLPLPTVASALHQEPGVFIQETTFGQASPILRGLTGYQTLILF